MNVRNFQQDPDHTRHSCGCPEAHGFRHYQNLPHQRINEMSNRLPYCGLMDQAWVVMLHKQGLVPTEKAKQVLPVLNQAADERGWGGEKWLKERVGGDEDLASIVNYGRTLQEPMFRMMMRKSMLYAFDELLPTMATLLDVAEDNLDTVMAGHSHWCHAQPTTYAAYLLAVHDGLSRGLEQLELAYRHTNQNSGGCGACSGSGWPVDRELVTELLGFDETIELAYDCEASQDEMLTILFAASNIATTLSRTAMDFNVWVTEEWNLFDVDMSWRGVSSFMPQKANSGNNFEHIRQAANDVLGRMMSALFSFKNEPIQDVLPVYRADGYVTQGLAYLEKGLGKLRGVLPNTRPNKERMWQLVRDGYSGAPDLAIHMIREKDYAGRCAHRICATMVLLARQRGIKPYDCTGTLLDEAARETGDPEPHLTDAEVQDSMSLEHFFEKHCGLGDPNAKESQRLIDKRRPLLTAAQERQEDRKARVEAGYQKLRDAIAEIMAM